MNRSRPKLAILAPVVIGLVFTLSLGTYLLIGAQTARQSTQDQLVTSNRALLAVSSKLMFNPLYQLDAWTLDTMLNEFVGEADIVFAAVRDATGQVVADAADENWGMQDETFQDLYQQALAQQDIVEFKFDQYMVLSSPISAGSEQIGTLEIVFDLSSLQTSLNEIVKDMLITAGVILVGAVLVSIVFTQVTAKPLESLANAANEIGRGNLNSPVPISGLEETAIVGTAMEGMRTELQKLYTNLELQVTSLEQRTKYLEATAAVARETASVLDLQQLTRRVVSLIRDQFGFFRQGIYILDSNKEWAVLRAASGEGLQELIASGFRLRVGQEGIIGHVTRTRKTYVCQDVHNDPIFVNATQTEETRSEVVLPLEARGELIGALDVQSQNLNAFTDDEVAVLQTLADQLAVAISNAFLFQQAQENLEALQRSYGELNRESWGEILQARDTVGFYCDDNGVIQLTDPQIILENEELPEIKLPITMRGGQVIGKIYAHKIKNQGGWTDNEIEVMKSLTERLNLALESAQLYQDTRQRAVREQLSREISDKLRRATSIEGIIQTAVNELYQVLDTSQRVYAKLDIANPTPDSSIPEPETIRDEGGE